RIGDAKYDPAVDMNGDGTIGAPDYLLWRPFFGHPPGPSGLACAGTRPCPAQNVLIVIADDVGLDKVGVYDADIDLANQNTPPATPQIDSLAAGGVRFRNAWANPVCSASRATLLSGLYGFHTGIGAIIAPESDAFRLDPNGPSVAREFRAAGYATGAFGKWH